MRVAARMACAMLCAVAFHAALAGLAVMCGWLSPDGRTLPELDLTSVELSFSDAPDETAAPVVSVPSVPAPPPEPEVRPPSPIPPPSMELPPDTSVVPIPAYPRRDSLSPEIPEAPDAEPPRPQVPQAAPSMPAPSQARVEAVKPPSPKRRIKPEYPKGARERREEGDVELVLSVNAEGMVVNVEVGAACDFAELVAAAVAAARKARFEPARQGGKAVPGRVRITLRFRLKE